MSLGRAIFQAHMDNVLAESIPIDLQWTLSVGVITLQTGVALSAGDNTIAIQNGTRLICIVPPVTSAVVLKLKPVAGDTGWVLQPALPAILTTGVVGGTSLILNAASPITITLIFLG